MLKVLTNTGNDTLICSPFIGHVDHSGHSGHRGHQGHGDHGGHGGHGRDHRGHYKRAQNYANTISLSMDVTMDRPSLDEHSVDMFGIEPPPRNMFEAVDPEVLMYYLEEKERGQREFKLDGTLLTSYMFKRHYRFLTEGFEKLLQLIAPMIIHQTRRGGGGSPIFNYKQH